MTPKACAAADHQYHPEGVMDLATALDRMATANFCASVALFLLTALLLWDVALWLDSKAAPKGQWCTQHGQPRVNCTPDQHRPK